jgi:hypothetical protein
MKNESNDLESVPDPDRTLDYYLLCLWDLARVYPSQEFIPAKEFVQMLEQAFTAEIPAEIIRVEAPRDSAFAEWQNTILGYASSFAEIKNMPQDDPFDFHGFANPHPRQFVEHGMGKDGIGEDVTWQDFTNLLESGKYYE